MGGGTVPYGLSEVDEKAIGVICEQITRRLADRCISPDAVRTVENQQSGVGAIAPYRMLELGRQPS